MCRTICGSGSTRPVIHPAWKSANSRRRDRKSRNRDRRRNRRIDGRRSDDGRQPQGAASDDLTGSRSPRLQACACLGGNVCHSAACASIRCSAGGHPGGRSRRSGSEAPRRAASRFGRGFRGGGSRGALGRFLLADDQKRRNLASECSRIVGDLSLRRSVSTRKPARRSGFHDFHRVGVALGRDGRDHHLHRREPEREMAGEMLDQDAGEALHRAADRPVNHGWRLLLPVLIHVVTRRTAPAGKSTSVPFPRPLSRPKTPPESRSPAPPHLSVLTPFGPGRELHHPSKPKSA